MENFSFYSSKDIFPNVQSMQNRFKHTPNTQTPTRGEQRVCGTTIFTVKLHLRPQQNLSAAGPHKAKDRYIENPK